MTRYIITNTRQKAPDPEKPKAIYPVFKAHLDMKNEWSVVNDPRTFETPDAAERYLGQHKLSTGETIEDGISNTIAIEEYRP